MHLWVTISASCGTDYRWIYLLDVYKRQSPLISLMKDQVEALLANGIAAGALNSSNGETENANLRRACIEGRLKLLYISPEKLLAEKDYLLRDMNISLFAIDAVSYTHLDVYKRQHLYQPTYNSDSYK